MPQYHSAAARSVTPVSQDGENFELDFLPVGEDGSGDAITVRYSVGDDGFLVMVVDGGYSDTTETIINHITQHYGPNVIISDMVLSHADNDHACGLIGVLERFTVRRLWMNRPWLYCPDILHFFHGNFTLEGLERELKRKHSYLVELEALAAKKGTQVLEAFQGAQIGAFTVLAPSRERYISLLPDLAKTPDNYGPKSTGGVIWDAAKSDVGAEFEAWNVETLSANPEPTSASNETSIVQLGQLGSKTVLLTADVGPDGLAEAARYAARLGLLSPPDIVQVPHHGSRRNVTPAVLNAWLGKALTQAGTRGSAYCSVAKGKAGKYPRPAVANAFLRRGYPVHCTHGSVKRHRIGYPRRPGWVDSVALPFFTDVSVDE